MLNKKIVYIDSSIGVEDDLILDKFKGQEYNFWAPLFNIKSWDEFVTFIDDKRIPLFLERFNIVSNMFKKHLDIYDDNLDFLQNTTNNNDVLSMYTDYRTGASERIINFTENLFI